MEAALPEGMSASEETIEALNKSCAGDIDYYYSTGDCSDCMSKRQKLILSLGVLFYEYTTAPVCPGAR